jgi:hypothetical protein
MFLKNWIKDRIRGVLGLSELKEEITMIREYINKLLNISSINKFIIALDYPPSRDYRPRWGGSHPIHEGLVDLFNKSRDEYVAVFNKLASLKPFIDKINKNFPNEFKGEPGWIGGPINAIDSALLYFFVSEYKPKTYLEIGSGVTTLFAARAKRDHGLQTKIISIDPQPRADVDASCDLVIRAGLETIDLDIFFNLEPGDIVFMDGSHRSFMNSDVTVFMLDVLPKLKSGVIVHFHDIHLPFDYPEMFANWYWNEQYILATYILAARDRVKILMPSRFMSDTLELKQELAPILNDWQDSPDTWLWGGSLWFTHQ